MSILPASQRLRLYDSDELDSVLQAMARQAAILLPPAQAALIGIQRRGEPLAQRLQQHLSRQTGQPELPLYPLKVKRYADDLQGAACTHGTGPRTRYSTRWTLPVPPCWLSMMSV